LNHKSSFKETTPTRFRKPSGAFDFFPVPDLCVDWGVFFLDRIGGSIGYNPVCQFGLEKNLTLRLLRLFKQKNIGQIFAGSIYQYIVSVFD